MRRKVLLQVPESGKIYAFNEGNYGAWAPHLKEYIDSLKDDSKWGGKPYSARCAQDHPHSLLQISVQDAVYRLIFQCLGCSLHEEVFMRE